ncbi:MAG: DJ-1/PfpI family protein [Candidatus Berkelbacteria bacterium]
MSNEKRVLMVIAPRDFQDHEYFDTKVSLANIGINADTASTRAGYCVSTHGKTAAVSLSLEAVDQHLYDGIVFVGGSGVEELFHNQEALDLASDFYKSEKIVAAICWAPVVLVKAGVLGAGKKATCWEGAKQDLIDAGVEYLEQDVVTDGKIITAEGPTVAHQFGQAIADAILKGLR